MIPAAATSAVERYLNSDAFGAMVRRIAFEKSPRYRFLTWMAWRFMAVNKAMTGEAAIRLAANTLGQFLKDDHIAFGHPDYAWDRAAAITLANECEIEHWEAAA